MLIRKEKVQYDWLIIASYFSLILIGSLAIYAVTFPQNIDKTIFDLSAPISRHLLFLVIALSLFSICLLVDWKVWHNFSYIIYAFSIALLILVLLIGSEIKGAKAWIEFGGFSIQPSEQIFGFSVGHGFQPRIVRRKRVLSIMSSMQKETWIWSDLNILESGQLFSEVVVFFC